MVFISVILAALSLAGVSSAHEHPPVGSVEYVRRANFQKTARRSLASCHEELSKRGGIHERARERRQQAAAAQRRRRELPANVPFKRDTTSVLATDHKSNLTGVTNNTAAATLFDGNSSCVLAPEVTQGPYWVSGEYVRWDIRDDTEGVDTYVDVQLIDVSTCQAVPNVYIDFWHANATGVYSGIVANGNGVGTADPTNIASLLASPFIVDTKLISQNNTFLRGIQATDSDGVAQYLTKFPGHYTGRTTHVHILAHVNATVFKNGTVTSAGVTHVGQFFFDQSLVTEVEATSPYSTNTQTLTTNTEDSILSEEAGTIDPMLDIDDGLMMWASMGIDTSADYTVSPAAWLTPNGGVANANAMGGGPDGGGGPPGGSNSASGSGTSSASLSTASPSTSSSGAAPDVSPRRLSVLLVMVFTYIAYL
ncbi:aromatic compound dioxygenase [Mycena amicta]|nr:aromatic compound dioxygenase [Mycena amicta]